MAASQFDEERDRLRKAFGAFDVDGSGTLSAKEFQQLLTRTGGMALTEEDAEEIIFEFAEGDELSIDEFIAAMASLKDTGQEIKATSAIESDELFVVVGHIRGREKPDAPHLQLAVKPTDLVRDVKEQIRREKGLTEEHEIHLLHIGKKLDDNRTLEACQVQPAPSIYGKPPQPYPSVLWSTSRLSSPKK